MTALVVPAQSIHPASAQDAAEPAPVLRVDDGQFVIDEQPVALVGVNASGAASSLALGSPCGYPDLDLDEMFASLPEHALVRVWFTQEMATRRGPNERVWDALDAVVAAAERSPTQPYLLVTLATGAGDCDGGQWRGREFFERTWQSGPEVHGPSTYAQWVDEVVTRYAGRSVIALWEPINEPDPSTCLPGFVGSTCFGHTRCDEGAASVLSEFLDAVGARIHELDADGLVSTGGGGWCGWYTVEDRMRIEATQHVDVLSTHDYHDETSPLPDGVAETAKRARWLGKPFIVGELGIPVDAGRDVEARADLLIQKVEAQRAAGADAVLAWVYGGDSPCSLCIGPQDPFMARLHGVDIVLDPPVVVPEAPVPSATTTTTILLAAVAVATRYLRRLW